MGVSRVPVREAVRRLQQDGLLEVRARGGVYVASMRTDGQSASELAVVPDGTVTLVSDRGERNPAVVQRVSRRARRNGGHRAAVVALTSHAGAYGPGAR